MTDSGEFILSCIGVYKDTIKKLNDIVDNFEVDFQREDVQEAISLDPNNVGNTLIEELYKWVFENTLDEARGYLEENDVDDNTCESILEKVDEGFTYFINSSDSHLYFLDEEYFNSDDLRKVVFDYCDNFF